MGVPGLWDLVSPAGRKVHPDTLTGKVIAVDASIWVLQFLKSMRDKDGNMIAAAHLQGFFKRLCKLIYFGVKPVIIFDGPPPELKKRTLSKRRAAREAAENSITRAARKLLLASIHEATKDKSEVQRKKKPNKAIGFDTLEDESDETPSPVPPLLYEHGVKKEKDGEDEEEEEDDFFSRQHNRNYYETVPKEFRGFLSERRRLDDINVAGDIPLLSMPPAPKLSGLGNNDSVFTNEDEYKGYRVENPDGTDTFVQLPLGSQIDQKVFEELPAKTQYQILEQLKEAWHAETRTQSIVAKDSMESFSHIQIESYIRSVKTNQQLHKVKERLASEHEISMTQDILTSGLSGGTETLPSDVQHSLNVGLSSLPSHEKKRKKTLSQITIEVPPPARLKNSEFCVSSMLNEPITMELNSNSSGIGVPEREKVQSVSSRDEDLELLYKNEDALFGKFEAEVCSDEFDEFADSEVVRAVPIKHMLMSKSIVLEAKDTAAASVKPEVNETGPAKEGSSGFFSHSSFMREDNDNSVLSSVSNDSDIDYALLFEDEDNPFIDEASGDWLQHAGSILEPTSAEIGSEAPRLLKTSHPTTEPLIVVDNNEPTNDASAHGPDKSRITPTSIESPKNMQEQKATTFFNPENDIHDLPNEICDTEESEAVRGYPRATPLETSTHPPQDPSSYLADEAEARKLFAMKKRHADHATPEMYEEVKEMLRYLGLPYIEAPGEAEAQGAYLTQCGLCDGLISDDSDSIVFGATKIYRNFFSSKTNVELYEQKQIKSKLGLSQSELINIALLVGCDYTTGVRGIGIVNAIEVVRSFESFSNLEEFKNWATSITHETGICDTDTPAIQAYKQSHRKLRHNWVFPKNFPLNEVLQLFEQPLVDRSQEPFSWAKKPDLTGLTHFLGANAGLSYEQIRETVGPALSRMEAIASGKVKIQPELWRWISASGPGEEDDTVGLIRSKRMAYAVNSITAKKTKGR